jgi:hypothetical protein
VRALILSVCRRSRMAAVVRPVAPTIPCHAVCFFNQYFVVCHAYCCVFCSIWECAPGATSAESTSAAPTSASTTVATASVPAPVPAHASASASTAAATGVWFYIPTPDPASSSLPPPPQQQQQPIQSSLCELQAMCAAGQLNGDELCWNAAGTGGRSGDAGQTMTPAISEYFHQTSISFFPSQSTNFSGSSIREMFVHALRRQC